MTLRWSEEQLTAHQKRTAALIEPVVVIKPAAPKYRSKWEDQYAQSLRFRQYAGEIKSFAYERITLVLPGGVRYTPDFIIEPIDPEQRLQALQLHEVKGRMRDSARIKLRQAIEVFTYFEFYLVGGDMMPRRLYRPDDVPATTR